jgi:hypothetical protein
MEDGECTFKVPHILLHDLPEWPERNPFLESPRCLQHGQDSWDWTAEASEALNWH